MRARSHNRGIRGRPLGASCCLILGALLLTMGASANQFRSPVSLSPGSVSFPSQTIDTTSAPAAVTLTNVGSGQVRVTSVLSSSLEFSYSGPSLPVVLAGGQSLSGFVTFTPAAAREYTAVLTFTFSTASASSAGSAGAIGSVGASGSVESRATVELSATGVKKVASTPPATPPAITSNPANLTVTAGQTAAFSVAATGTTPLSYQWKMNGTAIGGATSASYTTAAATTANSGETFSVAVSNSAGTATSSSATLTVNAPVTAPTISSSPANQTVTAGQTAAFSVSATGTAPLSYQWKMNGTAMSGATSASYTTAATTTANTGETFSVAVTNSAGTATSSSATLTVNPPATMLLNSNPTSLNFGSVVMGASASLPVTLSNSGNSNVDVTNVSISGAGFAPSGISTGQILAPGSTTMNVTFTPAEAASAIGTVTITSNATNSPTTISLSGAGTQPITYSVSLTWSPSTSSVVGYNVYRGTSPGGESLTSPINGSSLVGGESYSDTNVVSGTTYYYVVTAVNASGVQSADSSEASANVP
jgi:hypothetical protein